MLQGAKYVPFVLVQSVHLAGAPTNSSVLTVSFLALSVEATAVSVLGLDPRPLGRVGFYSFQRCADF